MNLRLDAGYGGTAAKSKAALRSAARCVSNSRLAVRQAEGHRAGGAPDVDQSDGPLHLVMAGLVEEIAEADDSRGFPDKVRRQPRRGAAEQPNHGIQFLSPALQVGASYREVSAIQSGGDDEQNAILPIPELVLDARVRRRDEDWRGSLDKRGRRVRKGC